MGHCYKGLLTKGARTLIHQDTFPRFDEPWSRPEILWRASDRPFVNPIAVANFAAVRRWPHQASPHWRHQPTPPHRLILLPWPKPLHPRHILRRQVPREPEDRTPHKGKGKRKYSRVDKFV